MKYIVTLLIGAVLGGALVFYLLVGRPGTKPLPGAQLKPPASGGDPPGTAVLALDEPFFNALLGSIFRDLNAPSFKLSSLNTSAGRLPDYRAVIFQGECNNSVVLMPEDGNVKTGVQLRDGKILTMLAFSGSYNVPFAGCTQFKGWAQSDLQLAFDAGAQTVYGRINVEGVNLDNASPLLSGPITLFVQNAINQRVNPLQVLNAQQIGMALPIQASGGTLKAQVRDVRSEVKDGVLSLHITYDFSGTRGRA